MTGLCHEQLGWYFYLQPLIGRANQRRAFWYTTYGHLCSDCVYKDEIKWCVLNCIELITHVWIKYRLMNGVRQCSKVVGLNRIGQMNCSLVKIFPCWCRPHPPCIWILSVEESTWAGRRDWVVRHIPPLVYFEFEDVIDAERRFADWLLPVEIWSVILEVSMVDN